MITYVWEIQNKAAASVHYEADNVVRAIMWRYVGTDENGRAADHQETSFFRYNPDGVFIPFEELTDEILISWILPTVDLPAIQTEIAQKITDSSII